MMPLEHDEGIQCAENVSSPRQEKHRSRLASWWRKRDLLVNIFLIVNPTHPNWPAIRLRIFGFLILLQICFVGVVSWVAGLRSPGWLLALFMGLSAFAGAFLLRSWWALLAAPCVIVISAVLPGQFELDLLLITVALPAFLGAALGSALVKHKGVS